MTTAYSYVRFSTKGQIEGDSLHRQLTAARKYAKENNLYLDDHSFQDLGVSAFKGANVAEGALGLFIAAVESGKIAKGSYLLLESLDRMSRNVMSEAQGLLLRLINLDIIVVSLAKNVVISKETYNASAGSVVWMALVDMMRAHEESSLKSDRVSKGWEAARKNKKILTRMAPSWLSVVNDEWVVDGDKAAVIQRIFELSLSGKGSPSIANILNDEGVPTFGKSNDTSLAEGERHEWSSGIVAHILGNKAVIGIYETAKIPAREGYFPEIIKHEFYYQVQASMRKRNFTPGLRLNGTVGNLFSGISVCGVCGAKMKTVSKANGRMYIHCEKAYSGKCEARKVAYTDFEYQVLKMFASEIRNVFNSTPIVSADIRPMLQEQIVQKEKEIEKLFDYLMDSPDSKSAKERVRKAEVQLAEFQKQLGRELPPVSDYLSRAGRNLGMCQSNL